MQDGAPAHNADRVIQYLEATFPNRWIGTNSPHLRWPARSPDLTPCDYSLWGTIKDTIHREQLYHNVGQLRNAIVEAFANITPDQISKCIHHFEHRLGFCSAAYGEHFEQYF